MFHRTMVVSGLLLSLFLFVACTEIPSSSNSETIPSEPHKEASAERFERNTEPVSDFQEQTRSDASTPEQDTAPDMEPSGPDGDVSEPVQDVVIEESSRERDSNPCSPPCTDGKVCVQGQCKGCQKDSDCSTGQLCLQEQCKTLQLSVSKGQQKGWKAGRPLYVFVLSLNHRFTGGNGVLQWKTAAGKTRTRTLSSWTAKGNQWQTTVSMTLDEVSEWTRTLSRPTLRLKSTATVVNLGQQRRKTNSVSLFLETSTQEQCLGSQYQIGTGIADITGSIFRSQMQGYANGKQKAEGLHMRLFARAFLFKSPCSNRRFLYLVSDLWTVTQSIHQRVLSQLSKKYGSLYHRSNVMLAGNHTHQGPGGYSYYALYNVTGLNDLIGFDQRNLDGIVAGMLSAIEQAHKSLTPGSIRWNRGTQSGLSKNRSLPAYNANKDRSEYSSSVDTGLPVLRFDNKAGKALGLLSWFGVHPTNLSASNQLVSGDNKGYAAWLLEQRYNNNYRTNNPFVAGFAYSNGGDATPNLKGPPTSSNQYPAMLKHATTLSNTVFSLFGKASVVLKGGIQVRQQYVNFANTKVAGTYTGQGTQNTCEQALGLSFVAASTEDSSGLKSLPCTKNKIPKVVSIKEGMTYDPAKGNACDILLSTSDVQKRLQACHGKKDVFMPIGLKGYLFNKHPWTPAVLPVQLVRMGHLAFAGVPFELSTMAGRRLRQTILQHLAPEVTRVILSSNTNAYSGYATTKEEYDQQHYEGASTQFGPWTLAALRQTFANLALSMKRGTSISAGPAPANLSISQLKSISYAGLKVPDLGAASGRLGKVRNNPPKQVKRGSTVSFSHWCGHPNHDFRRGQGYVEIQRKVQGKWELVEWDASPRLVLSFSIVKIPIPLAPDIELRSMVSRWSIPSNASTGTYRFVYRGVYRNLTGKMVSYNGGSSEFKVQ